MDLLLVANDFPNPFQPTRGIFNLHLARALAREHAVRVIAPIPWVDELRGIRRAGRAPGRRRGDRDGIEIHHPRYYYPPKVLRDHYGAFYWASILGTARRVLAARRPEAVVGYWAHPDGEAAVRIARRAGAPSAVIIGGSDVLLLPRDAGRRRRVVRVLESTDAVLAVSRDLKEKIIELGIRAEKVHVWHQGVDTGRFFPGDRAEARHRLGIPTSGRFVLWAGRMVPVKGLDVLLEAFDRLRAEVRDARLWLAGDGPLRRALEADVAARGLQEAVAFVGAVSHDRLADWYRAADVTVLPSRSEGLPNVLRESAACGTPFVASRVGGIPEIADAARDHLVPPGDAPALSAALARALLAPALAGPAASRSGDWSDAADAIVGILRSANRDRGLEMCGGHDIIQS